VSHRAARRTVTAVGIVIVLGGCGGGGGAGPSISAGASQQLRADVDAVRAAVTSGDRAQAVQALATLQSAVTQLQRQGQVSADRAVSILGAAADVDAQLGLMPTTTTTVSTTTTLPKHKNDHGGAGD
jgi:hypothetical protein